MNLSESAKLTATHSQIAVPRVFVLVADEHPLGRTRAKRV